jgi:hypothetical protein
MRKTVLILVSWFVGLIILAIANQQVIALDDLSLVSRPTAGDTIRIATVFDPVDSTITRVNQLNDSLDIKFIRFVDFADSTIGKVKCDSIRSNPDIDSIAGTVNFSGKIVVDSITGLDVLRGNPNVDSITGGVWWSGTGATFSDSVYIDTLVSNVATIAKMRVYDSLDLDSGKLIIDKDGDTYLQASGDDAFGLFMNGNNSHRFTDGRYITAVAGAAARHD